MKRCLIVDDSRVVRKVARRIVEDLRFDADEAADGQQALETCRKSMPDAVLLDWNMPVMNGIDFLRAIRDSGCPAVMTDRELVELPNKGSELLPGLVRVSD
jgi:CheY-like chemotaxis protein